MGKFIQGKKYIYMSIGTYIFSWWYFNDNVVFVKIYFIDIQLIYNVGLISAV